MPQIYIWRPYCILERGSRLESPCTNHNWCKKIQNTSLLLLCCKILCVCTHPIFQSLKKSQQDGGKKMEEFWQVITSSLESPLLMQNIPGSFLVEWGKGRRNKKLSPVIIFPDPHAPPPCCPELQLCSSAQVFMVSLLQTECIFPHHNKS